MKNSTELDSLVAPRSPHTPSNASLPQEVLNSTDRTVPPLARGTSSFLYENAAAPGRRYGIDSSASKMTTGPATNGKSVSLFSAFLQNIASMFEGPKDIAYDNSLHHLVVPITNRRYTYPISIAGTKIDTDTSFEDTKRKYAHAILPPTHFRNKQMVQVIKRLRNATPFIPDDLEVFLIDRSRLPTTESGGLTTGGNKVFIMTSMFDRAVGDPQIAFVICHEIGHCLAQHLAERTALCAANGIQYDSGEYCFICREQEYEADQIGREICRMAGYPSNAGIALLERSKGADFYLPRGQAFSRHPTCGERIVALKAGGRRAQL